MLEKTVLSEDLVKKFDQFRELIIEWNRFSLVAKSTLEDLWGWHFQEALSVISLLEENHSLQLYDFGAGAGVIGHSLSLLGFSIYLVERSYNKLFFLQNILKNELVLDHVNDYSNSLVLVRGVAKIIELLRMLKNVKKMILFKSYEAKKEINQALRFWSFQFEIFHRVGRSKGLIIYIFNIQKL